MMRAIAFPRTDTLIRTRLRRAEKVEKHPPCTWRGLVLFVEHYLKNSKKFPQSSLISAVQLSYTNTVHGILHGSTDRGGIAVDSNYYERLADGLSLGRVSPWRITSGQYPLILTALATMRKKTRLAAVPLTVNIL